MSFKCIAIDHSRVDLVEGSVVTHHTYDLKIVNLNSDKLH